MEIASEGEIYMCVCIYTERERVKVLFFLIECLAKKGPNLQLVREGVVCVVPHCMCYGYEYFLTFMVKKTNGQDLCSHPFRMFFV